MKIKRNYLSILLIFNALTSFTTPHSPDKSPNVEDKPTYLTGLELEVIDELNLARTQPKVYADFLASYSVYFIGNELHEPGKTILVTREGKSAVNEAIKFLNNQKPLAKLTTGLRWILPNAAASPSKIFNWRAILPLDTKILRSPAPCLKN